MAKKNMVYKFIFEIYSKRQLRRKNAVIFSKFRKVFTEAKTIIEYYKFLIKFKIKKILTK